MTFIVHGPIVALFRADCVADCVKQKIKRILVVTGPYHSRRASIFFNRRFAGSGIHVVTVNSGDYWHLLPPTEQWWCDEVTLRWIITETVGIAAFLLLLLSDLGSQMGHPGLHPG